MLYGEKQQAIVIILVDMQVWLLVDLIAFFWGHRERQRYGPTSSGTLYTDCLEEAACASFKFALGCSFGRRGSAGCTNLSSPR
nr:hypothetical protein CFP56_66367 [Quercus suber]